MSVSTLSIIHQELDCFHPKTNMLGSPRLANDLQEDGCFNLYDLTTTCEFVRDLPSEDEQYQLADIVDNLGEEISQLRVTDKGLDEKGGGCKRPVEARKGKDELDGPTKKLFQTEQKRPEFSILSKTINPEISQFGGHPVLQRNEIYSGWAGGSEISSIVSPSNQGFMLCDAPDNFWSNSSNISLPPFFRTISGSSTGSNSSSFFSAEDESNNSELSKDLRIKKILEDLQSPLPSSSSAMSLKPRDVCGPPDGPRTVVLRGPPTVGPSNENAGSIRGTNEQDVTVLLPVQSSPWRPAHASPVTSPRSLYTSQPSPESYPLPPTPISPDNRTLSPYPSPHPSPPAYAGCSGPPAHACNPRDGSVLPVTSRSLPKSNSFARDQLAVSNGSNGSLHSIPACLPPSSSPVQGRQSLTFSEPEASRLQQWSPSSSSSKDSLTGEDVTLVAVGEDVTLVAIGEDRQWRQDEYGDTYLHALVTLDDDEAAEQLNILHTKVGLQEVINRRNIETETPLYSAVEMERTELTRLLLKYGANVNLACRNRTTNMERTPLHVAVEKGYINIVKILLSCEDIDIDAPRRPDNYTALMVALDKHRLGHPSDDCSDIIQYLIEEGADLTARDGRSGNTVLMMAVAKKDVATVQRILDAAGPLEARKLVQHQSMCGNSALHVAAGLQNVSEQVQQHLFRLLIKSGGDTELKNNEQDTPRNFNRNLLTKAGRMK